MNELDQCHSRMVPEKIWDQVLVKWEALKDASEMLKIENS